MGITDTTIVYVLCQSFQHRLQQWGVTRMLQDAEVGEEDELEHLCLLWSGECV